jgi:uncharacterized protein (DUF305 family)
VGLLAALALGGCSRAAEQTGRPAPAPASATAPTPAYNEADAEFMTGMIAHHAQAVLISGWAPTHGASAQVQRLAERIVVGQEDETVMMERWLRQHGLPTPASDSSHGGAHGAHGAHHGGADHAGMPGMLTAEQLARLDRARGTEFDRLFLTLMIEHHRGALVMVDRLFASYGAAQGETVFRLASDVQAEQSAEIRRMEQMLAALPGGSPAGSDR